MDHVHGIYHVIHHITYMVRHEISYMAFHFIHNIVYWISHAYMVIQRAYKHHIINMMHAPSYINQLAYSNRKTTKRLALAEVTNYSTAASKTIFQCLILTYINSYNMLTAYKPLSLTKHDDYF